MLRRRGHSDGTRPAEVRFRAGNLLTLLFLLGEKAAVRPAIGDIRANDNEASLSWNCVSESRSQRPPAFADSRLGDNVLGDRERGMPTTFLGLFLFSLGLSLVATFIVLLVQTLLKRFHSANADCRRPR